MTEGVAFDRAHSSANVYTMVMIQREHGSRGAGLNCAGGPRARQSESFIGPREQLPGFIARSDEQSQVMEPLDLVEDRHCDNASHQRAIGSEPLDRNVLGFTSRSWRDSIQELVPIHDRSVGSPERQRRRDDPLEKPLVSCALGDGYLLVELAECDFVGLHMS